MRGYILLSFSPKNHYDHRLQRDGSSSSLVQLVLTQLTNKVTQFLCQQQWLAHYPPARPPKRKSSIRGFLHVRREIRRKKKVVPSSSIYYGIVNNSFSNSVCVCRKFYKYRWTFPTRCHAFTSAQSDKVYLLLQKTEAACCHSP